MRPSRARIAIIGGGPGGYEAALVAAQLGAEVTLAERDGLGGACVLTDCVPSKTLIETSSTVTVLNGSADLGIRVGDGAGAAGDGRRPLVDATRLHGRIKALAWAQSADVAARVAAEGVEVVDGTACLVGPGKVRVGSRDITADAVLIAVGAHPRVLPDSVPDGERILNWRQLYDLPEIPEELIVVGSGVTGAEFASAYQSLGSQVTLVSSRERVLPHEDVDAAVVIEEVFRRRGMTVLGRSRAAAAKRHGDRVVVTLTDGRVVRGSHCLLTVGMEPSIGGLGCEDAGVKLDDRGFVTVDRVSRTSTPSVYAAGDCTGLLMLASVAAMQGRIAMWHALGEAVHPIRLSHVAATIFTDPEIATVGVTASAAESGKRRGPGHGGQASAGRQPARQDGRDQGRFRQAVRAAGHLGRAGRRRRRPPRQRAHPAGVDRGRAAAHGGSARADVHRLPLTVRQRGRGGPQAHALQPRRRLSRWPRSRLRTATEAGYGQASVTGLTHRASGPVSGR